MTARSALRALAVASLMVGLAGCSSETGPVRRIVVVTFDTTRADHLGCYGYSAAETPRLDEFASEALLFEHAVSQVPTTLPSHTTMFTGLYPQDHGIRTNLIFRLGDQSNTVAEILKSAGFATAGFPATFIVSKQYGLDQGFDHWVEPPAVGGQGAVPGVEALRPAGEGVDLALEWLRQHAGDPAFVWLHFYDAHAPYRPPFPYSARFREHPYDGEIAYADAQFGRLLDALRGDGRWDETLLVVAGDHGEGLYDHNEAYHSFLVYEPTQHVPLIVYAPGVRAGRVNEPVALADLMPTMVDLAGLEVPDGLRGISLRPALEGRDLPRRSLYFETLSGSLNYGWAELTGVRRGDWKLIDGPEPELYNLVDDPGETDNLASLEAERVADLRAELQDLLVPVTDEAAATEAHDPVLDPETMAYLISLGYVGNTAGGGSSENAPNPVSLIDMTPELLAAQQAVSRQHWGYVVEFCEYVRKRDPANKWALATEINALISIDRPTEAQEVAEEFVRLYPDNSRAYQLSAWAYRAENRSRDALEILKRGREVHPDDDSLRYLWLVALFDLESPSVCDQDVPDAVVAFPSSYKIRLLEARCRARAGDTDGAVQSLGVAVTLGLHSVDALREAEDFREVVASPGFDRLVKALEAATNAEP